MYNINDIIKIAHSLGVKFDKFPLEELIKTLKMELVHGNINPVTNVTNNNLELSIEISLAHLNKFHDYYNKQYGLPSFENSLKNINYY